MTPPADTIGLDEGGAHAYPEDLRAYTTRKLALAGQLRGLMEVLRRRGSETRRDACEELMAKLAEDRFTLAVLGQFKRGKSSLMNAILGRAVLPAAVVPLTSAITVLKYGPVERLAIERENSLFAETASIAQLVDFVTEAGNPGNQKRVKRATVEMPLPFLRRGLEFVDTPGIGSAIQANTATAYAFLPQCDAALFVTSVDTPLTAAELQFLEVIREHVRKLFFIVNKTDLLTDNGEREQVLEFVRRTLQKQMGTDEINVLPVSAKLGLAAGAEAFARSGLQDLRNALAAFLAREKAAILLSATADKALRLVEAEFGELDLYSKACALPERDLLQRTDLLKARLQRHHMVRNDLLDALRGAFQQQARKELSGALEFYLQMQQERVSGWAQRIARRGGWSSGGPFARRCARGLVRRLRTGTLRRLSRLAAPINLGGEEASRELLNQLETNLNEIPQLADAIFDLFHARQPEPAAQRQVPLTFEAPFLLEFTWHPLLPAALRMMPARLARSALCAHLEREYAVVLRQFHQAVLGFLDHAASSAVHKVSADFRHRADELESRILAAITGERPPRPAYQQVMAPLAEVSWGDTALAAIRRKLLVLRDCAAQAPSEKSLSAEEVGEPFTITNLNPPRPRTVESDMTKTIETRGCAVCRHLVDIAWNFLAQWQYALAVDEKAQEEFAAENGFCPLHLWQLEAVGSPVGLSVGFAKWATRTSELLRRTHPRNAAALLRDFIPGAKRCRVCAALFQGESKFMARMADFLRMPGSADLYARSQGLCLRHLTSLLQLSKDAELANLLLLTAARRFEEAAEDMQSYAMKRDAIRRPLTNPDENDAAWRALVHFAGERYLCASWPVDGEIEI